MLLERLLEDLTRGQWLIPRSTAGLTIAEAHGVVAVLAAAKELGKIRIPIECQHRLIRCYDEFLDEKYGRADRAIKTPVEVLFDVCGEINAALAKLEGGQPNA